MFVVTKRFQNAKYIANQLQIASFLKKNPVFKGFLFFFCQNQKNASSQGRGGTKSKVWCSYLQNCDL